MLKIEVARQTGGRVTIRLEGRMVGPWVEEVQHACEPYVSNGHLLTLDFSGVSFVDRDGVTLCRTLRQRRTELRNCSPFVKEQINA